MLRTLLAASLAACAVGQDQCVNSSSPPPPPTPVNFEVCGQYCGPGWCSGKQQPPPGLNCSYTAMPQGCMDSCCMDHDRCCDIGFHDNTAGGPRSSCNQAMLECIDRCTRAGEDDCLTRDGYPVPGFLFSTAINAVPDWCCDQPCATPVTNSSEANGTQSVAFPFGFVVERIRGFYQAAGTVRTSFNWETDALRILTMVWLACLGSAIVAYCALLIRHWRFQELLRSHVARVTDKVTDVGSAMAPSNSKNALAPSEQLSLAFVELGYTTAPSRGSKSILRGITGCVLPGELIALMGPSGSGKTTLLDVLAHRRPQAEVEGTIYANGISCATTHGQTLFKSRSGYMLQLADTFSLTMTVRENLAYAAALRLSDTLSGVGLLERVELVIDLLQMKTIGNVVVGGATGGGISGGQKRKLALGVEMLAMPAMLLLDEPTSGLDSTSSLDVMNAVRGWCNTQRSAIVTIHQPRKEIFAAFDKLVLLFSGNLSLLCSPTQALECMLSLADLVEWHIGDVANPADVMLDFLTHDAPKETGKAKLGDVLVGFRSQCAKRHNQPLLDALGLSDDGTAEAKACVAVQKLPRPRSTCRTALASLWNRLWVLESRFLKQQSLLGLHVPSIEVLLFCIVFATLYFRSSLLYALAACLFLVSLQTANIYALPIIEGSFAPVGTCYHFEVAAGAYTAGQRLLHLHLHYTAANLPFSLIFTSTVYALVRS